MTDDDWTAVVRWLRNLGLDVKAIYPDKRQLLVELPQKRDT